MNTVMDISSKQNQSDVIANIVSRQRGNRQGTLEFVDNRQETVAQRKLQDILNEYYYPDRIVQPENPRGLLSLSSAVAQRKVENFNSTGDDLLGPYNSLYEGLWRHKADLAISKKTDIKKYLALSGLTYHRNNVQRTEEVTADKINTSRPNGKPERTSKETGLIGGFARDSLFLNREFIEKFEGGHLIAHALWDKNDPKVDLADSALNVVGMSRTMNIGIYKAIENVLMKDRDVEGVKIKVTYGPDFKKTVDAWAEALGIPVNPFGGKEEANTVTVNNWVPEKVELTNAIINLSPISPILTEEPARFQPFSDFISTPHELKTVLESHGIWNWMDPDLQLKILLLSFSSPQPIFTIGTRSSMGGTRKRKSRPTNPQKRL